MNWYTLPQLFGICYALLNACIGHFFLLSLSPPFLLVHCRNCLNACWWCSLSPPLKRCCRMLKTSSKQRPKYLVMPSITFNSIAIHHRIAHEIVANMISIDSQSGNAVYIPKYIQKYTWMEKTKASIGNNWVMCSQIHISIALNPWILESLL